MQLTGQTAKGYVTVELCKTGYDEFEIIEVSPRTTYPEASAIDVWFRLANQTHLHTYTVWLGSDGESVYIYGEW